MRLLIVLRSVALVAAALQVPLRKARPEYGNDSVPVADAAFERFVEDNMARWHVPGLAMAILDGDRTWTKGFGYATVDSVPVTPKTLFYCGSMTKSMTAAALSLFVDEFENIQWSTPVSSLLPDFVLSDEWATGHVTIEDALSHRTGYPKHDYAGPFLNSSVSMLRSFRHLPMANEPRVKWAYNNLMYGAMGYLVETLSGSSLADFFRRRLWHSMGMFDTYLHPDDALASDNVLAHPYYWDNDTESYGEIPWRDETNIAGAGMSISSVLDWSRYLRHMMRETGPMSAAGHHAVKFPSMVSQERDELFTGPIYYGYGWWGSVFQNEQVWWHSGLVDSMMSIMMMVPSRDFGFVVMMNNEGTPVLDSIIARTMYDYFGVQQDRRVDLEARWNETWTKDQDRLGNCSTRIYPSLASPKVLSDVPLADLAGDYFHPGYGPISVTLRCEGWEDPVDSPASPTLTEGGCRLVAVKSSDFGKQVSWQLEHKSGDFWIGWQFNDDFATVRRPTGCYRAQFRIGSGGRPTEFGLDIRMEEEDVPLTWFVRSL